VQLTQQGNVIRRKDFLDLVHITLRQQQQGGQQWEWRLQDDGKGADTAAGDGTFSYKLNQSMKEGRHELTLLVDGTTFQREQRQVVNIYSQPAQTTVTADPAGAGRYVLSVIPYAGLIEPDSLDATAIVTDAKGVSSEIKLTRAAPAEWRAELKDLTDPAGYQAEFRITGNRSGGKPVSAQLGPIKFGVAAAAKETPDQTAKSAPAKSPQTDAHASPDAQTVETAVAQEPGAASEQPSKEPMNVNWYLVIGQIILINALLIGGGFFAYRHWWRSDKRGKVNLVEDDSSSDEDEPLAPLLEETKP
jgi:uncharacterized protein (TIGR03503 family)